MASKLFGEVLQGKKPESSFIGLSVEELKGLKNSASSIISRANTLEKRQKAEYLRSLLDTELSKHQDMTPKAAWKKEPVEALDLTEVNKAIKQAQWYKHTYGPKAKANWQKILSESSKDDAMYTKAKNFLGKCDELYLKSLEDEEHWLDVKDSMLADPTNQKASAAAKVDEIKDLVESLENSKLNKQTQGILEKLKGLLSK